MTQIRPITIIQQRARQAFEAGHARNSHGLPASDELDVWLGEYDRCYAAWAQGGRRKVRAQLAEVSPP